MLELSGDIFESNAESGFLHGEDDSHQSVSEDTEDSGVPTDSEVSESAGPETERGVKITGVDSVLAGPANVSQHSPEPAYNALAGLNRQLLGRVLLELEHEGPKLRRLGEHLADAAWLEPPDVDRFLAVKSNVEFLCMQLSQLCVRDESAMRRTASPQAGVTVGGHLAPHHHHDTLPTVDASSAPRSAPPSALLPLPLSPSPSSERQAPSMPSGTQARQRKQRPSLVIFPPSPEKSQKRQDSYSIH
ncbi:hypothetical protein OH77DRAFT_1526210 [Trametes cingulata]|nr:hypothetical protein OH77DRAFT_1526210 [Trametes cingulata]